jgi:hypothetical protein
VDWCVLLILFDEKFRVGGRGNGREAEGGHDYIPESGTGKGWLI